MVIARWVANIFRGCSAERAAQEGEDVGERDGRVVAEAVQLCTDQPVEEREPQRANDGVDTSDEEEETR
jgi:hypothetical protein